MDWADEKALELIFSDGPRCVLCGGVDAHLPICHDHPTFRSLAHQALMRRVEPVAAALRAAAPQWIDVRERLPEGREPVFIVDEDGLGVAVPDGSGGFNAVTIAPLEDRAIVGRSGITHWMPLPAPPKEESDA